MATLSATLENLACHAWAHTYTILLAMESKEVGAAHKAGQLQEQFGCSFHSIVFTLHTHDPSEMPGKASNVNAAVRQFYHMVTGDRSTYMLTIMDAGARGWLGCSQGGRAGVCFMFQNHSVTIAGALVCGCGVVFLPEICGAGPSQQACIVLLLPFIPAQPHLPCLLSVGLVSFHGMGPCGQHIWLSVLVPGTPDIV
jgi:hypothetical protein